MPARYSVIIPTLNEEKFLPKLLASLAEQTDKNFEVIVVDGSSKDKTVAVANSYVKKLPKLQVIVSKKASLPLQRNLGAKAAKGEWFIFVDADSILMPSFIERSQLFVKEQDPGIFATWCSPDSQTPGDANMALLANMLLEMTIIMNKPWTPGPLTAVRRDVFNRMGGYGEDHAFHEDMDFGMRASKLHIPIHVLPETLYTWSLRRFRQQGTLKVIQQLIISAFPILLFNRTFKKMPGYVMGGQLYTKKKKTIPITTLRRYEKNLKKLLKEIFE